MRELEYQTRVLDAFNAYLDVLKAEKEKADQVEALKAAQPDLPIPSVDFAKATWEALKANGVLPPSRAGIPFSERQDGCERGQCPT